MAPTKERLIRKFAKGYERRTGAAAYIPSSDLQSFLAALVSEFSGICVGIRKDRGQGLFLSVMASGTREQLYFIRVRNTNARGVDRTPVRYSLTLENKDVILDFGK